MREFLFWFFMFAVFGFTLTVFVAGTDFVFAYIVPILQVLDICGVFISIVVFGPLAVFRKSRSAAATGFLGASFLFYASTWMYGFVLLQAREGMFGGVIAIILTLFTAGLYVPLAAIREALLNTAWETIAALLVGLGFAGCTFWLSNILDKKINRDASGASK